ncbi:MAG: hypothetical protein AAFU03_16990, partial [Bacteroidota bacterium]
AVPQSITQYDVLRMATAPQIETYIIDSDEYPKGVGEPGVPPATPALVNALFAATGKPIRNLPLVKQGFRFV